MAGGDAVQNGWQKNESVLTPDNIAANFKFLWKIKLGQPSTTAHSFSEPLLAGRLINAQGFKDIVYWSTADTVFAVDSELGTLVWKKEFKMETPAPAPDCGVSNLNILMEPPPVINFRARRRRAPGTPRPPRPAPPAPNQRRLGVTPGGEFFGLKGIYVLTPDGMLHEQVVATGADFAPPVKFLPAPNPDPTGFIFANKAIYTVTQHSCGVPGGLWSIDLGSGDYAVASYATQQVRPVTLSGPAVMADGTSILVTGAGTSDPSSGAYAGSVVSIGKDMKVADWYTPSTAMGNYENVSPIIITYKEKQLVVAPGKDGSLVLLDAASLGGADHHTPLFETPAISQPGEKHTWDGFASWQDKSDTVWVFASVSTGISLSDSRSLNGAAPRGGVVAFKVEDKDGSPALSPAWVSPDMLNPAPPRVANGVVVALAGGDKSTRATLYVLNAATGAVLYSSKSEIPTYTQLSGVSVGDGHAFFTDRDNYLYSFGIGMEH